MMKNPAMRGPCDCLAHSLEEALELIEHCQKKKALQHFLTAGDIAKQLRRVREDIQWNATLAILAIATQNLQTTNNIQDELITLTMTLTRRIDYGGGADPLLTQAQVHTTASPLLSGTMVAGGRYQVVLFDGAYRRVWPVTLPIYYGSWNHRA